MKRYSVCAACILMRCQHVRHKRKEERLKPALLVTLATFYIPDVGGKPDTLLDINSQMRCH